MCRLLMVGYYNTSRHRELFRINFLFYLITLARHIIVLVILIKVKKDGDSNYLVELRQFSFYYLYSTRGKLVSFFKLIDSLFCFLRSITVINSRQIADWYPRKSKFFNLKVSDVGICDCLNKYACLPPEIIDHCKFIFIHPANNESLFLSFIVGQYSIS